MSDSDRRGGGNNTENPNTGVVVKARPKTRKPAMYKVLMLNDDYTPMEFVVHVLERLFQKNRGRRDSHHATRPPARRWRLWRFYVRSR